ncbi:MAG: tyrosine-type recombinase/integrase [Pirellulales bacterium]
MANKVNFTKSALAKITPPKTGRLAVYDTKQPSLLLRVTPTGSMTFCVFRRVAGRPTRVCLGGYPALTIEQARKLAAQVSGEVAQGVAPTITKRRTRGVMTVGELFDLYLEQHAKPHKKSWAEDERQFNRYLTGWKNRKITTIRRADVQSLHTHIGTKCGIYAANRLRSLLHTMFTLAADHGFDGPNPAHGVKKFREHSRERFLVADELRRFFGALQTETSETIRDYLLLSLLTGARRGNMLTMAWAEIDFARAVWNIPDTKSGDPLSLPLSPEAITVLARRRETTAGQPWVFPGVGKSGHLQDVTTIWKRVLQRAELEDVRLHDLRRTLASWQALTGASLPVIGRSLGHKAPATTAIYARLTMDPVRASVNTATAAILTAAGGMLQGFPIQDATDQTTVAKRNPQGIIGP